MFCIIIIEFNKKKYFKLNLLKKLVLFENKFKENFFHRKKNLQKKEKLVKWQRWLCGKHIQRAREIERERARFQC